MSGKSNFRRRPDSIGPILMIDKWLSFSSSIFDRSTFFILFSAENDRSPRSSCTPSNTNIYDMHFPDSETRPAGCAELVFGISKVQCRRHQELSSYCSWFTRESEWPLLEKLSLGRLGAISVLLYFMTLETVSLFSYIQKMSTYQVYSKQGP